MHILQRCRLPTNRLVPYIFCSSVGLFGSQLYMAGSVCATTRASKTKVVEEVTILLNKSSMVFSVPSSGIKVGRNTVLGHSLPMLVNMLIELFMFAIFRCFHVWCADSVPACRTRSPYTAVLHRRSFTRKFCLHEVELYCRRFREVALP